MCLVDPSFIPGNVNREPIVEGCYAQSIRHTGLGRCVAAMTIDRPYRFWLPHSVFVDRPKAIKLGAVPACAMKKFVDCYRKLHCRPVKCLRASSSYQVASNT